MPTPMKPRPPSTPPTRRSITPAYVENGRQVVITTADRLQVATPRKGMTARTAGSATKNDEFLPIMSGALTGEQRPATAREYDAHPNPFDVEDTPSSKKRRGKSAGVRRSRKGTPSPSLAAEVMEFLALEELDKQGSNFVSGHHSSPARSQYDPSFRRSESGGGGGGGSPVKKGIPPSPPTFSAASRVHSSMGMRADSSEGEGGGEGGGEGEGSMTLNEEKSALEKMYRNAVLKRPIFHVGNATCQEYTLNERMKEIDDLRHARDEAMGVRRSRAFTTLTSGRIAYSRDKAAKEEEVEVHQAYEEKETRQLVSNLKANGSTLRLMVPKGSESAPWGSRGGKRQQASLTERKRKMYNLDFEAENEYLSPSQPRLTQLSPKKRDEMSAFLLEASVQAARSNWKKTLFLTGLHKGKEDEREKKLAVVRAAAKRAADAASKVAFVPIALRLPKRIQNLMQEAEMKIQKGERGANDGSPPVPAARSPSPPRRRETKPTPPTVTRSQPCLTRPLTSEEKQDIQRKRREEHEEKRKKAWMRMMERDEEYLKKKEAIVNAKHQKRLDMERSAREKVEKEKRMARQREWLDIIFVAAFATKLSTALDTYRGEKYLIKRREEAAKVIQRMTRKKFFRKKMAAQRSATNTIAKFVSMHYDQYRKRRMNRATDIVKDALKTVIENGKLKTVMYSFRNRVVKSQQYFKDLKLIHTAQRDLLVRQFQREEAAIIKEAVTQYKSTFARSQLHREEQLKHDRGRMYFGRVPYKGPQITRIPAPSLPASRTQRVPHDYLVFITNEWHHRERRKFGVQWTQYKQDLRRYNAQTSRRQAFVHFLAQAVQGKAEASENEAVPDTAQTRAETILDKVLEPNPAPRRPVFSRLIPKEELRAMIMQAREDCNIPPLHFEPTY